MILVAEPVIHLKKVEQIPKFWDHPDCFGLLARIGV